MCKFLRLGEESSQTKSFVGSLFGVDQDGEGMAQHFAQDTTGQVPCVARPDAKQSTWPDLV